MKKEPKKATRVPVDYRFDAMNPEFEAAFAQIAAYADAKYESCFQYALSELTGDKSPLNHAKAHINKYQRGIIYDHFDGGEEWHLVAAAYNLMMMFLYHRKFGFHPHPLAPPEVVVKRGIGKVQVLSRPRDEWADRELDRAHNLVRECAGGPPRHGSPQGVKKLRKRKRRK